MKGSQDGSSRQELKQRPMRNTVYWVALSGLTALAQILLRLSSRTHTHTHTPPKHVKVKINLFKNKVDIENRSYLNNPGSRREEAEDAVA